MFKSLKRWYQGLPDKKRYLEFLTAFLTIPVLVTVLLTNIGNLNKSKETTQPVSSEAPNVTVIPVEVIKEVNQDSNSGMTPTPIETVTKECKKEIGPVEIVTPGERQVIKEDPVVIDIAYKAGEYCSIVFAYRINEGAWSEFTNKSISLYGLSNGEKKLDVWVKSIASKDELVLHRTFKVENALITPPTSTGSASF